MIGHSSTPVDKTQQRRHFVSNVTVYGALMCEQGVTKCTAIYMREIYY